MEAFFAACLIAVFGFILSSGLESPVNVARMLSVASQLKVQEGETVELPCKVENVDRLVRVWKHLPSRVLFSGSISVSRDQKVTLSEDGSLQLHQVTPEYAGEYSCQIHQHPGLHVLHKIEVLVPPTIMPGPSNGKVIVRRDYPVIVFCNVTGSPFPSISWTYEREDKTRSSILPGGARLTEKGTQLLISSVDVMHSGIYRCSADNDVGGPVTVAFNLTVLYVPEVVVTPDWTHGDNGATTKFVCTCKSIPQSHVNWLKGGSKTGPPLLSNDHIRINDRLVTPTTVESSILLQRLTRDDLGPYTCLCKNSVGQSWKTAELSGLAEPVRLRGTMTSDTSFSLLWTTKSYSPIIEYQLKIRQYKGDPDWTDVSVPAAEGGGGVLYSQSYEITGLEPGLQYEALVLVHNDFGWNRAPDTLFFHTGTLITEPDDLTTDVSMLPLIESETAITEPTSLKQDASSTSSRNSIPILLIVTLASLLLIS